MYDSAPNTSKTSEETRRTKRTNESSMRNGNETIIVYDDDDTPRDEELGRKWGKWDTPTDRWEAIDVFEFVSWDSWL